MSPGTMVLPAMSIRVAPSGNGGRGPDGLDAAVRDDDRGPLERCGPGTVNDAAAGQRERTAGGCLRQ